MSLSMPLPPLLSLVYVMTMAIPCAVFRRLVIYLFGEPIGSPITQRGTTPPRWPARHFSTLLFACINSFELVICALENAIFLSYGGFPLLALVTILHSIRFHFVVPQQVSGKPQLALRSYLKGDYSATSLVMIIVAQAIGGLAALQFSKRLWWSQKLTIFHAIRYRWAVLSMCRDALHTQPAIGFLVEACGVLLVSLVGTVAFYLLVRRLKLTEDAFPSLSMTWLSTCLAEVVCQYFGLPLTGMYMNPVEAIVQNWGCAGHTLVQHVCVYCIAPLTAEYCALFAASKLLLDEQATNNNRQPNNRRLNRSRTRSRSNNANNNSQD